MISGHMSTLRFLLPALVLFAACEKKKTVPAPETNHSTPVKTNTTPKKTNAPTGVPPVLKTMLDAKWPALEAEGKKFNAKFEEAKLVRNNRAALTKKIEEARLHYNKMKDIWAEIAYWPTDQLDDGKMNEATYNQCERYLLTKERIVKGWDKKAKGLKELSTVK